MEYQGRSPRVVAAVVASLFAATAAAGTASADTRGVSTAESPTIALMRAMDAAKRVDDAALRQADGNIRDWMTHGRTYREQRFSPLDEINDETVGSLGLKWAHKLNTDRGVEATPLVVDGIIYATLPWSKIIAVDARSGERLWTYDPEVPGSYAQFACCDVVNRGPALYKGKVYAGTIDGRMVAVDAATGELVWQTQTTDPGTPYTITGAPRIVKGRVLIGNGGAEYGVRGYVSAYDAETGRLDWRFYTVPRDPAPPFASPAHEKAAETWGGDIWYNVGGGGTPWDAIVYDPDLNLVFVGTGNPSPWPRHHRGFGDNLYINSVVALDADSGELVWYYQENPGDHWDYTSVQPISLADIEIDGEMRKALLHAPKNGHVYVLDRATGEFLSADPYVTVTWAEGFDPQGRPIESKSAVYGPGPLTPVWPGNWGGHNWHPQSYSPDTGLLYIPAQEIPTAYSVVEDFKYSPGVMNLAVGLDIPYGPVEKIVGNLIAWDPVQRREVWRQPYDTAYNGGILSTHGNLVFQGTADGRFLAYAADDGQKLWETWTPTGVLAGPISYEVDGQQYVTVMAGWGASFPLTAGAAAAKSMVRSDGWMLTFALDGNEKMPAPLEPRPFFDPPMLDAESASLVKDGEALYNGNCFACHGKGAVSAVITDLRFNSTVVHDLDLMKEVVLEGAYEDKGMPNFGKRLSGDDVAAIRAFLIDRAHQDYEGAKHLYEQNMDKFRERLAQSSR
ncbi:MAG: PQQ-dependent dehydrogenase, methanol/ethanol family [Rhodospirillaceae bacterium]|nr:PQQ-dependent dehydrogenase, methanol/ethanol family [Rhodospirillaceae bacterium]